MTEKNANNKSLGSKASLVAGYSAIGIGIVLITIKAIAYYMSGALGILSSLTDSVADSLISLVALASVYYAAQPADKDHRWGHGKMEAVFALFQAAMIAGGGVFLVFQSLDRLAHPQELEAFGTAIIVLIVSIILSIILVWIQRRSLEQNDSLAIEADSLHYSSDILINSGALIVIVLTMYGMPFWIDALFALGVAFFMAKMAWGVAAKALDMLLDKELPEDERTQIKQIIEAHEQVAGWHDLRTRKTGTTIVIMVDVEVDPTLTLGAAHNIATDLEEKLHSLYADADIFIHLDPEGDKTDLRHRVKGVHV
ncbi:MAG: cation diffusion facilitator family transporter [Alphaproteobacteria bacterium]